MNKFEQDLENIACRDIGTRCSECDFGKCDKNMNVKADTHSTELIEVK